MNNVPQSEDRTVVLVVDDEPLVRIFTVQVLQEAGYAVDEARDCEEALSRLRGRQIGALVTDIQMPGGMDGCGLAWHVHGMFPEVALLVTSGVAKPAPHELPPKTRFLPKPLAPQLLVHELGEALGKA